MTIGELLERGLWCLCGALLILNDTFVYGLVLFTVLGLSCVVRAVTKGE